MRNINFNIKIFEFVWDDLFQGICFLTYDQLSFQRSLFGIWRMEGGWFELDILFFKFKNEGDEV